MSSNESLNKPQDDEKENTNKPDEKQAVEKGADTMMSSASTATINSSTNSLKDISILVSNTNATNATSVNKKAANNEETGSLNNVSNNLALNEKVANLASSIYTELEKIIKLYGRDTVKDLMSIVVNILEALDIAYHEKEELIVENELLKDDYEKLLSQYEREKQHRKDTELKLFQSEDSFAEQKRDYEEKVKSLESIVRMIDLKSKNTSDHVMRLEEKENELKREYNKLHERYTELFKTHCDYMERTKLLFGYDGSTRLDCSNSSLPGSTTSTFVGSNNSNNNNSRSVVLKNNSNNLINASKLNINLTNENSKQLFDLLVRSSNFTINKNDLINALKLSNKSDIHSIISIIISASSQSNGPPANALTAASAATLTSSANNNTSGSSSNNNNVNSSQDESMSTTSTSSMNQAQLNKVDSSASLSSMVVQNASKQSPGVGNDSQLSNANDSNSTKNSDALDLLNDNCRNVLYNYVECSLDNVLGDDGSMQLNSRLNLQSENFDEHLTGNCVEFDDNILDLQNSNKTGSNVDVDTEYDGEYDGLVKNDLSLFNELSKENYDITELDDGADLTGMTREVANLIRENSELLQTKHALNVLKDDLIVRLDQFSSEMVILREEIKSLQTVKACLQLRITELEEEARKAKEELIQKNKKLEEEDETLPISQRKRFTRAEMARVLMERNQYKERLMDLQEAVRWTEMIRASKMDNSLNAPSQHSLMSSNQTSSSSNLQQLSSSTPGAASYVADNQHNEHKKRSTMWKFFSDLFGTSANANMQQQQQQPSTHSQQQPQPQQQVLSPKTKRIVKSSEQVVPLTVNQSEATSQLENSLKLVGKDEQSQEGKNSSKLLIDKKELESVKEDGRMQAYGWSLPYKNSIKTNDSQSQSSPNGNSSASTILNISVPVPVYCRPLFQKDNELDLKLSCASTINYLFDYKHFSVDNYPNLIDSNKLSYFESISDASESAKVDSFKTSCIWICNFNENDTHISILDANKPSDLIKQFTLKSIKIHCLLSVSGAFKEDIDEEKANLRSFASRSQSKINDDVQTKTDSNDLDNITYIEFEATDADTATQYSIDHNQKRENALLSTLYPTMWLGSQEGFLLVHSSISDVDATLDKVKLKDAILSMSETNGKVIVGLADGSVAIFVRNKLGLWDLKNYYLINFDSSHHSVRCLTNVYDNVWCGCRNKIYILNTVDLNISSVIEVHPRKENQVRHLACYKDGVWVSIRLDSTLRLYHSKTLQQLQYLDIEPFITRMLGTSNLGLSLVRVSSLIIASKRLWIGTGNGVVLSIPFNQDHVNSKSSKKPGSVVRVNTKGEDSIDLTNDKIPFCNISDAQFSFHGHRDAVKFFLNVPNQTIKKTSKTASANGNSFEKMESVLLLSGGHGYIDFRIGDSKSNQIHSTSAKSPHKKSQDELDTKLESINNNDLNSKRNDRSYLIVWQINKN